MTLSRLALLAALCLFCLGRPIPAHAQIGYTLTFRADPTRASTFTRYGSVALYPLAPFNRGGVVRANTAGTDTLYGGLAAVNYGFQTNGRAAYEIGGWYWANSGRSDLYQIHLRAFATPELGVQVGRLGSTHVGGQAYTAFALYDFSAKRLNPNVAHNVATEFGLGLYDDPTGGETTVSFTGFVQLSVQLERSLTVNGTAWYVRDRNVDLNRFTLGLGYGF